VALGMCGGRRVAGDDRSSPLLDQRRSARRSRHGALVCPGGVAGRVAGLRSCGAVGAGDGFADAVLGELRRCRALVIGPGIGSEPGVVASVRRLVAEAEVPVIVDADGLGALGPFEEGREVLAGRKVPAVLTPHDGEYARLAATASGADSRPGGDRVAAARSLANGLGAIVLLKGSTTAVAAPDGHAFLVRPDRLVSRRPGPVTCCPEW